MKSPQKLSITYGDYSLKQRNTVEYLGYYLDSNLNGESWYPLLSKALKTKLQIAQNKCIRFCLELPLYYHISPSHFKKINCNNSQNI